MSSVSLFPFYTSSLDGQFVLVNGAYQPNITMEVHVWHSIAQAPQDGVWAMAAFFCLCFPCTGPHACSEAVQAVILKLGHRQTARHILATASQC